MGWKYNGGKHEFWSQGKRLAEVYKTAAGDWFWSAHGRSCRQGSEETLRSAKTSVAVVLVTRKSLEPGDARKVEKVALLHVLAGR